MPDNQNSNIISNSFIHETHTYDEYLNSNNLNVNYGLYNIYGKSQDFFMTNPGVNEYHSSYFGGDSMLPPSLGKEPSKGMSVSVCDKYRQKVDMSRKDMNTIFSYVQNQMMLLSDEWYGSSGDAFKQLFNRMNQTKVKVNEDITTLNGALANACYDFNAGDQILNEWNIEEW